MDFAKEDVKKGFKICPVCRGRVFQLDDRYNHRETRCGRCNCYTADESDFLKEAINHMQKD